MKRQLSSSSTFFGKFIFSAVFILATVFVILTLIVSPIISRQISWSSTVFAISWTAIALSCCCLVTIPLKVVSVDEDQLYIFNFYTEIALPFSQVVQVEELNEFGFKLVLIRIKSPTKFGRRIKFLPDTGFRPGKKQSIFEELKELTTDRSEH